jgi:hypothetical protein
VQEHLESVGMIAPVSCFSKNYFKGQGNDYELKSSIFVKDGVLRSSRKKHAKKVVS